MAKRTDFAVRDVTARATKRIRRTVRRYDKLDDQLFILKTNQKRLNKILNQYHFDLAWIKNFFTANIWDVLGAESVKEFTDAIREYPKYANVKARAGRTRKLVDSIQKDYALRAQSVSNGMIDSLGTKFRRFRAAASVEEIPAHFLKTEFGKTIESVTIKGKTYNKIRLGEIWDQMSNTYGSNGTIQYRNGANFPLDTYINGKSITMSRDIQNNVTIAESAKRDIQINKISWHGSKDSCNLWENKYVFISIPAKQQFLKLYPEIKVARTFRIYNQLIEKDKSHIFKFNCRHRLMPAPLQLFDKSEMKEVTASPPVSRTSKTARERSDKLKKEEAA